LHGGNPEPLMSALGQNQNVRFTSESGHWLSLSGRPLCAKSGHYAVQQERRYSITSSARANSVAGTVIPNALAVLRLIAKLGRLLNGQVGRLSAFKDAGL
jgi:hypothetical protein